MRQEALSRERTVHAPPGYQPEQARLRSTMYVPQTMPAVMNTWGMTAVFVLVILFVSNVVNAIPAGAATLTYWLLGALGFFLPSLLLTAGQAVLLPYEGALYTWAYAIFTHETFTALGSFVSFFAAFCDWFPAIPLIVSTPVLLVPFVQGLNPHWLTAPWQQGLLVVGCLLFSALLALQRTRMVQYVLIGGMLLLLAAVVLLTASGVTWLMEGHPSATSFTYFSDWAITWDNRAVLGVVALAYLGANLPLRLSGELAERDDKARRSSITRHLALGGMLVLLGYLLVTLALLIVQGPHANYTQFALISTVDLVLGKVAGNVVAVCLMGGLLLATVAYQVTYARLLMVGGIDGRLPMALSKLNRYRAPAVALRWQTGVSLVMTVFIYFTPPSIIAFGLSPADVPVVYQNVMLAALTLVWAFSQLFLLLGGALLCGRVRRRQPQYARRLLPQPLLWGLALLGSTFSVLAMLDTLLNPWITQLSARAWGQTVGGVTIGCLLIAAIASMIAISEAGWETLRMAVEPEAEGASRREPTPADSVTPALTRPRVHVAVRAGAPFPLTIGTERGKSRSPRSRKEYTR